jgi:hypothetical protein
VADRQANLQPGADVVMLKNNHSLLCSPKSIHDVQILYEQFFIKEDAKRINNKSLPWLGELAAAAASNVPLFVILPTESFNSEQPLFFSFEQ